MDDICRNRLVVSPCRFITVHAICLRSYGKHMTHPCTGEPFIARITCQHCLLAHSAQLLAQGY